MTFDLLLAAPPGSRRAPAIAERLASCADGFVGAVLHDWAIVDPASTPRDAPEIALDRLVAAQMALADDATPVTLGPRTAAAMRTN
jgi:flagellar biosynthesis protein FlhG